MSERSHPKELQRSRNNTSSTTYKFHKSRRGSDVSYLACYITKKCSRCYHVIHTLTALKLYPQLIYNESGTAAFKVNRASVPPWFWLTFKRKKSTHCQIPRQSTPSFWLNYQCESTSVCWNQNEKRCLVLLGELVWFMEIPVNRGVKIMCWNVPKSVMKLVVSRKFSGSFLFSWRHKSHLFIPFSLLSPWHDSSSAFCRFIVTLLAQFLLIEYVHVLSSPWSSCIYIRGDGFFFFLIPERIRSSASFQHCLVCINQLMKLLALNLFNKPSDYVGKFPAWFKSKMFNFVFYLFLLLSPSVASFPGDSLCWLVLERRISRLK